jgi:hypothetical protein
VIQPNALFEPTFPPFSPHIQGTVNLPNFQEPPAANSNSSSASDSDQDFNQDFTAEDSPSMSDDDDATHHTFKRGNDTQHYLDSVPILTQATSNSTTAPSDSKLIARAISGCASGARQILMRWKQQLTPAELLAMETVTVTDSTDPNNPIVTAHHEAGRVTYEEFRRIFTFFFPLVCVATAVNKFLKMK